MKKRSYKYLHDLILKQSPKKSDVIVWLQGDRYDRAQKVFELFQQGWTPKIIITGNNVLIGMGKRGGEKNISLNAMEKWLINKGIKKKDIIIENKSMNTKEQAENVMAVAKKNKWRGVILVGSSYGQPRAFLTFLKQSKKKNWAGKIFNQPAVLGWDTVPGGRDKVVRKYLEEEMKKIDKYKYDLVTIKEGIEYLELKAPNLKLKNEI